jgi:uncharacterized membrane protein YqjE
MNKAKFFLLPAIIFILSSIIIASLGNRLRMAGIDPYVCMGANILMLLFTLAMLKFIQSAVKKSNPNIFVRTVMAGTFIKILLLASAALVYILFSGENRSVYGIAASMGLYVIYTIAETKTILKINKEKN